MDHYGRKLAIGVTGILVSTVMISYFTEKIFNQKYRDVNGQRHPFIYPSLVTWLGCLFCTLYGMGYAAFVDKTPNRIILRERLRLGTLFTLNYLPTNYALLYISYPLQVVSKNTRYILVVIVGAFFSRVRKNKELRLPKSKILIAVVISLGAGLFMYFDSRQPSKENHFHPEKKWFGFLLLLVAITCDAFFSDSQAYCKASFSPSQNQLFLSANLYGFMLIFLFSLLSGELSSSLSFVIQHPEIRLDLLTMASLQVISQVAVYYVISNFKQHIYPLISTVRKLLTILFSIYIFKHQVHFYQWVSIGIVFAAMVLEMYDQVRSQEYHRKVRQDRAIEAALAEGGDQEGEQQAFRSERGRSEVSEQNEGRSEVKEIPSAGGSNARRNYHMSGQTGQETSAPPKESLSKYGYKWRKNEISENRQTSLTPVMKEI